MNSLPMHVPKMKPARVGVFGIGLAAYWPQFDGLKERLEGYQRQVEQRLREMGAQVVSAGMVDDPQKARSAGDFFATEQVDLVICYVGTYATSSQVLPAVQRQGAPVLVLNLQAVAALDYPNTDTAEWLANCSATCVPEIANAFQRCGIQVNIVSGLLTPAVGPANVYFERAWRRIGEWVDAAAVLRSVRDSRIGFLGHTYPGMLDMYSDFTMHHGELGIHVEVLEMDDLRVRVASVTDGEVAAKLDEIHRVFIVAAQGHDRLSQPITDEAMTWTARVACGLDRLVDDFDLDGLTYYYRGLDGNENEELAAALIVGNSLLTARGVPASGEGDLKTCIAMMVMDRLGAGGSYTEFYALDYDDGIVLMGHDGPGHVAISDQPPVLRGLGLYHGKRGFGISVEFKVKTGPITLLGLTQTREGRLKLIVAEGDAVPGPTLEIGNTNSRLKFPVDPATFMDLWCHESPTHHCALGVGSQAGRIQKFSRLAGLELAHVAASGRGLA